MLGSVFNRTRRASGQAPVQCKLRSFIKHSQVHGFSEFQGIGPPEEEYGLPGDIYLDVSPGDLALYGRDSDEWKKWQGPDDMSNMVIHPKHRDRCLWCNGDTYGWVALRSRYKAQGKSGLELLSAAAEKAALGAKGKKRKIDQSQESTPQKRVHVSTSVTPPRPTPSAAALATANNELHSGNQRGATSSNISSNANQSHSPRGSSSRPDITSSKSKMGDSNRRPHSGASHLSSTMAGPSRITLDTLRASPAAVDTVEDDADESDEADDGDDDEQDELCPTDRSSADEETSGGINRKNSAAHINTPQAQTGSGERNAAKHSTNTILEQLISWQGRNVGPEQQYSATAIAAYIKPILQEVVRLQQTEKEALAARVQLQAEVHQLQTTDSIRTQESSALSLALQEEQENVRAYVLKLVKAQDELAALKEAARRNAAYMTELEAQRLKLIEKAKHNAEILDNRNREFAELEKAARAQQALQRTTEEEAMRIEEANKQVEVLKSTLTLQSTILNNARAEIARLQSDANTTALSLERTNRMVANLEAVVEANTYQIKELELTNKSLIKFKDMYLEAKAALEKLGLEEKSRADQLSAAHAEIAQLRSENASLKELLANVKISSTPKIQGRQASRAPSSRCNTPESMARPQESDPNAEPCADLSVDRLDEDHVSLLLVEIDDSFLCKFCIGAEPESITYPFKSRSSFQEIHYHNMQEHREYYEIVRTLSKEDLSQVLEQHNLSSESS